ncbi:sister chromatid cohesion protein PDS5 homolog D-like [Silene latifolia]|uniref:sister chromatid cohesion protein PDS5 homolog D-like n=1 Tax=Silene latifolia TaxID=37657 RepID=UPI003D7832DB
MAAALSDNQLVEQLSEFGIRLSRRPSSAPELLNLLDELELLFSKMKQSPRPLVRQALLIPTAVLMEEELFKHSDTNVRITVASCLNEATRICAPDAPFEDDKMRDIFELIVSSFEYLSCEPGRCYSKAVVILQSVARLRSCVMMLDLDCDSLVVKMFELFQKNASPKHPQAVIASMVKIMSVMIQETDSLSPGLLKVLLDSIKIENQGVSPVSWEMGVKVLEGCADKLKPDIMETVSSMGYSLDDYAPILSSICKPVVDTVTGVADDSSILVNNEPSGDLNDQVENDKSLTATESCRTTPATSSGHSGSKALVTGGPASERRKKPNSHTLDKEAGGREHNQLGDSSMKKAKPTRKDNPGVSGNKALRKKNDVPGASGSSGKKLPKQQEISGGSGSKSKTGQTRKDKFQSNDSSKKRKRAASSDDDDVVETPHGRKKYKDDLVGCRIKVWWPLDRRFYEGTITSYDASVRKHRVDYDDGDEENLNLRTERWELLGDEAPVDIASLLGKKTAQSPPIMPRHEASIEEKEIAKMDDDEKGKTPTSDVEIAKMDDEARDNTTTTVMKSEIPESLPENKKAKLSDGQSS